MKKLIFIGLVFIAVSCNQSKTCVCELTLGSVTTESRYTFDKAAQKQCDDHESNMQPGVQLNNGTYTCHLEN